MAFASSSNHVPPDVLVSGETCRRSSLSPAARFAIFFGVLFGLKYALPYTGLSAAVQVLALAGAATVLAWRFWWGCGESRRGAVLIIALFWLAAAAKIVIQ
jgi:hypothetical protein